MHPWSIVAVITFAVLTSGWRIPSPALSPLSSPSSSSSSSPPDFSTGSNEDWPQVDRASQLPTQDEEHKPEKVLHSPKMLQFLPQFASSNLLPVGRQPLEQLTLWKRVTVDCKQHPLQQLQQLSRDTLFGKSDENLKNLRMVFKHCFDNQDGIRF